MQHDESKEEERSGFFSVSRGSVSQKIEQVAIDVQRFDECREELMVLQ